MFTLFRFGHVRKVTCLVSYPCVHFISVRSCPEGDLLGILSMCSLYFGSVKSGRWPAWCPVVCSLYFSSVMSGRWPAWCPVRVFTVFRFGHVRQKIGWGPYTHVCTSPSSLSTLRSSLVRNQFAGLPRYSLPPSSFALCMVLSAEEASSHALQECPIRDPLGDLVTYTDGHVQ